MKTASKTIIVFLIALLAFGVRSYATGDPDAPADWDPDYFSGDLSYDPGSEEDSDWWIVWQGELDSSEVGIFEDRWEGPWCVSIIKYRTEAEVDNDIVEWWSFGYIATKKPYDDYDCGSIFLHGITNEQQDQTPRPGILLLHGDKWRGGFPLF